MTGSCDMKRKGVKKGSAFAPFSFHAVAGGKLMERRELPLSTAPVAEVEDDWGIR